MRTIQKDFYRIYSNGVGAYLTADEARKHYLNVLNEKKEIAASTERLSNMIIEQLNIIHAEQQKIIVPSM